MRQKRAVELKVKVDRSDNMNEQELSELRSEIKVCISHVNILTCTHSSCNVYVLYLYKQVFCQDNHNYNNLQTRISNIENNGF